jgi:hypothetical protein
LGGTLLEEDHFCVAGSGSTVLWGHLDTFDMKHVSSTYSRDDAVDLVTQLLRLAVARDGSSGGLCRVVVLDQDGLHEHTLPAMPHLPNHNKNNDDDHDDGSGSDGGGGVETEQYLTGFADRVPISRTEYTGKLRR